MQHAACVLLAKRTPSHLSHAACTVPVVIADVLLGIFTIGDRWRLMMSFCEFRKRERDDDVFEVLWHLSFCQGAHFERVFSDHAHAMHVAGLL